ncbi:hypothetical protein [uncultured Nostoc sp.]
MVINQYGLVLGDAINEPVRSVGRPQDRIGVGNPPVWRVVGLS